MKAPLACFLAVVVYGLGLHASAEPPQGLPSTAASPPARTAGKFADAARELQEFRRAIREIERNGQSLLNEYHRSNLRILEFGEFINQYLDNKTVPAQEQLYPYGMQNFGNTGVVEGPPLPPRQEWVKHYSNNITELTGLARNELSDVLKVLPKSDLSDRSNNLMDALAKSAAQLQSLVDGDDAAARDNAIAEINDICAELELSAKRMVRDHMIPRK